VEELEKVELVVQVEELHLLQEELQILVVVVLMNHKQAVQV
tara:strand:+ start:606 stop:728 length:123 start_codon:yes stop_codon:yes gene_type:complete